LGGITVDWANNLDSDLAGYNIYRSDSQFGTYTKLNIGLLTSSVYMDGGAKGGTTSWYHVTAVDTSNNESAAAVISGARPADTVPPAQPGTAVANASTSGISLDWPDNTEIDLAGYNVYRSASASGPWTKLNLTPITTSAFLDSAAPTGTSYYQVTAVDTTGNESTPSLIVNATRVAVYTATEIGSPTPAGSTQT